MSDTSTLLYSPIEEGRFDRLARAGPLPQQSYRLAPVARCQPGFTEPGKEPVVPRSLCRTSGYLFQFSSDSDHLEQVLNLVKAQFTGPAVQQLSLQPIVWGYLLQKLLPLNSHSWDSVSSLIQPLFSEISSSYWHADYKPLPLFLGTDKLKICLTSDRYSRPIRLANAVKEYLSPYVADASSSTSEMLGTLDFHSDPADEFPAPQDPRLRALWQWPARLLFRRCPWQILSGTAFSARLCRTLGLIWMSISLCLMTKFLLSN